MARCPAASLPSLSFPPVNGGCSWLVFVTTVEDPEHNVAVWVILLSRCCGFTLLACFFFRMLYVKGKICEGRMWRKAQLTEGCCGVAKYYSIYLGLKSLNNVRNAFPATPLKGISLPRHVHLPKCSVVSANRVFPFCLQVDLTLSAREQKLSVWHIFCVGLRPSSLIPCSTQVQARNGKFCLFPQLFPTEIISWFFSV